MGLESLAIIYYHYELFASKKLQKIVAAVAFILMEKNDAELNKRKWFSIREAAEYLRWTVDDVDANLVPLETNPAQIAGKLRYRVMALERDLHVRVLAGDVFSVLPVPPLAAHVGREQELVHA